MKLPATISRGGLTISSTGLGRREFLAVCVAMPLWPYGGGPRFDVGEEQGDTTEERPVLETSWHDDEGNTHTVKTDCNRYTSTTSCANAHRRAVQILKKVMGTTEDNEADADTDIDR